MAGGVSNGSANAQPAGNAVPLSFRRSPRLDLSTVERRGQKNACPEHSKKERLHGLTEAPTFRPSEEEFRDPMEYIKRIAPEGKKFGICKIIPPDGWNPDFAVDTEVSAEWPSRASGLDLVNQVLRAKLLHATI